jgi:hypothetical protein|nr:MAG TPA: hypothetical protein [Bacteriophage sp.]
MIKLFKYEGFRVTISEEALALKPFKLLWNRDKSKDKSKANNELAFIYFYADPRSDFQIYIDDEERMEQIKDSLGLAPEWQPDAELEAAIEYYKSFKPLSSLLLEDARFLIDNLRKTLRSINIDERDDKGKPVFQVPAVMKAIKEMPDLIKMMDETEKALFSDVQENSRMRGNKQKSVMDDGIFG